MILQTSNRTFDLSERTHIMGILNVTPDSFSDGGKYTTIEKAVEQAVLMEQHGADMIDVGGESTRPGHIPVTAEEEIKRVVPVIKALKKNAAAAISVDTFKAEVARKAVEAGADIINDIWGAKHDPEIAKVAAEYGVPIILMHNRKNENYQSIMDDMKKILKKVFK